MTRAREILYYRLCDYAILACFFVPFSFLVLSGGCLILYALTGAPSQQVSEVLISAMMLSAGLAITGMGVGTLIELRLTPWHNDLLARYGQDAQARITKREPPSHEHSTGPTMVYFTFSPPGGKRVEGAVPTERLAGGGGLQMNDSLVVRYLSEHPPIYSPARQLMRQRQQGTPASDYIFPASAILSGQLLLAWWYLWTP